MQIVFSDEFKEDFKKIKDKQVMLKLIKQLKKLERLPESGKPLRYELSGQRSLRIPPFRIIYQLEQDKIIITCFEHRKDAYQ